MNTYETYNRGSLAYKRDLQYANNQPLPSRQSNPRIIEGGGKPQEDFLAGHAFAIKAAKFTVICALIFAGIGFGRITLDTATVNEAMAAQQYESQLEVARSAISDLQVEQSSLSNPTRIKEQAKLLGMESPSNVSVIDISGDVVELDDEGNLSLSKSLETLVKEKSKGSK